MSLLDGLATYWACDDGAGTSVFDATANGHTASITSSSQWTASGKINDGLTFLSSSSQILDSGLRIGSIAPGAGSISLWAFHTNGATSGLAEAVFDQADAGGGNNEFCLLHYSDNKLYMGFFNAGIDYRVSVAASSSNWPTATWIHYCLTWVSGGTLTAYCNASSLGTKTSITPFNGALNLGFGHYIFGNSYYSGRIDEIGIWSRALTSTEVSQLYNGGQGLSYPFNVRRMGRPLFNKGIIVP